MPELKFTLGYKHFETDQNGAKDVFGLRREELIEKLGQPDKQGVTSRKYKTPSIYKYLDLEFYFEPESDGRLFLVYREDSEYNCTLNLEPDHLNWSS